MTCIGSISPIKADYIKGDLLLYTSGPMKLGGHGNPKSQKVVLEMPEIYGESIKCAILDISTTSREKAEHVRWKLWFNGFSITREFRPQFIWCHEEKYYSRLLYDVTPIMRISRGSHTLVVLYEGSEELIIDNASLIAVYEDPASELSYAYHAGILLLDPGSEREIEINLPRKVSDVGELHVLSFIPSRSAKVSLSMNNRLLTTVEGDVGLHEMKFDDVLIEDERAIIKIKHHEAEHPYYPKHLKIMSIILSSMKIMTPKITVTKYEYLDEENAYEVFISNVGEVPPDKIIVLAVESGVPFYRKVLNSVDPKEEVSVKIPLRNKDRRKLSLRIVWVRMGRRWMETFNLNPPS